MPSSYEGKWGRVTYSLRAKLTRSIWLVHKAKAVFPFRTRSEFPFASKTEMMVVGLKVRCDFQSDLSRRCHALQLTTPCGRSGPLSL